MSRYECRCCISETRKVNIIIGNKRRTNVDFGNEITVGCCPATHGIPYSYS